MRKKGLAALEDYIVILNSSAACICLVRADRHIHIIVRKIKNLVLYVYRRTVKGVGYIKLKFPWKLL